MSESTDQGQAQEAAIYGPAARHAEHQPGQPINFIDPESGRPGTGTLLYVRAPGATHEGGSEHPTVYIVDDGHGFPRALYASDMKE